MIDWPTDDPRTPEQEELARSLWTQLEKAAVPEKLDAETIDRWQQNEVTQRRYWKNQPMVRRLWRGVGWVRYHLSRLSLRFPVTFEQRRRARMREAQRDAVATKWIQADDHIGWRGKGQP